MHEGSDTVLVRSVRVRLGLEQHLDHARVRAYCRVHERREPTESHDSWRGPRLYEHLGGCHVAVKCRVHQCRRASLVLKVDVCAVLQQDVGARGAVRRGSGCHQRREAVTLARVVHLRMRLAQACNHLRVPLGTSDHHRVPAVGHGGVSLCSEREQRRDHLVEAVVRGGNDCVVPILLGQVEVGAALSERANHVGVAIVRSRDQVRPAVAPRVVRI